MGDFNVNYKLNLSLYWGILILESKQVSLTRCHKKDPDYSFEQSQYQYKIF